MGNNKVFFFLSKVLLRKREREMGVGGKGGEGLDNFLCEMMKRNMKEIYYVGHNSSLPRVRTQFAFSHIPR